MTCILYQLAAGMLGELFSPGDFGSPDGGEEAGVAARHGGTAGIILPEFRPTGASRRQHI